MKQIINYSRISLLFLLLLFTGGIHAQWHKFKRVFSDGTSIAKRVVTAPTNVLFNTAKVVTGQGGVRDIYRPVVKLAQTTGTTVVDVVNVTNIPQALLTQQAQRFASRVAGRPGAFIFDLGSFMQTYTNELNSSSIGIANNVLHGRSPFQVIGAPLAAAIRAAHDRYSSSARPLPDDVKDALQGQFSPEILNSARYAIGSVEIALPNFIIQGRRLFHSGDFAVTVDDIIVFPYEPGGYTNNCEWWAHELTHVRQYKQWGVEQFAYNYVKNYYAVENEAIQNATRITGGNWCVPPQQRAEMMQMINEKERNAAMRSEGNLYRRY